MEKFCRYSWGGTVFLRYGWGGTEPGKREGNGNEGVAKEAVKGDGTTFANG